MLRPELLRGENLRDDEVLVQLEQLWVLPQEPMPLLQLAVDAALELGQELLEEVLGGVPLADLTMKLEHIQEALKLINKYCWAPNFATSCKKTSEESLRHTWMRSNQAFRAKCLSFAQVEYTYSWCIE